MNKLEGIIERLQAIYVKDKVILKDLVLLKICFLLGEDAALQLELHWDDIFEEVNDFTGTNFGEVLLSFIFQKHKGRPPKNLDLIFKFLLGMSERNLKTIEREKKMREYLSKVEVKDRRNPHFKRAKARANTWVSTSVARARDSFHRIIEDSPATKKMYELLSYLPS